MSATTTELLTRLAEGLTTRGWFVAPSFLEKPDASALAAECMTAWQADDFRKARVGRGADMMIREDIRRDEVLWLESVNSGPAVRAYLSRLEEIKLAINRGLFLGLRDFEGHFAVYPEGAFYKAHLDRHRGTADRLVTVILYLNPEWREGDGGRLKLWTGAGNREGPFEWIEPVLGTLVVFLSGEHWHEVEVSKKLRMSVTGWLRVDGGAAESPWGG